MDESESPGEVTRLLQEWRDGHEGAFDRLMPVVYSDLHHIALGLMRRERASHTLQPTALLNELYVKLVNQRKVGWNDRHHFFTFTARLMRNILMDHARGRLAERRGGPDRIDLPLAEEFPWIGNTDEALLDLNRALDRLEQMDPRKARLVELRFFLSFTVEEAAEVLEISRATAERDLKFARGWLYRELRGTTTA